MGVLPVSGRRKSKPVSLAGRAALKQVPTHTLSENGPTPERLMQAGVTVAMQLGTRQTQIIGRDNSIGFDGVIRLTDTPLDRLASRNRLDEADPDRNRQLFEAGDKLRNHFYIGGLSGFAANDLNGGGGGHPASRTPISETMESSRRTLRIAESAVRPHEWIVVRAVVCEERTLLEAGREIGYGHEKAAQAVALDRLRSGLADLAELWGFSPPSRPRTHGIGDVPPAANDGVVQAVA